MAKAQAVQVIAIDIDADTYLETTSTLIVELPAESSARQKILQIETEIAQKHGFDAVADEGQKYVMLHW